MRFDRTSFVVLLALAASLAAHLLLIVPALVGVMSADRVAGARIARFAPDDFRKPDQLPEPEQEETHLGLDAPNPTSFTWVGYEEYQKHLAALSQVEQAAFTDDPVAAAPAPHAAPPLTATAQPEEAAAEIEPAPVSTAQVDALRHDLIAFNRLLTSIATAPREADETDQREPEPAAETQPRSSATAATALARFLEQLREAAEHAQAEAAEDARETAQSQPEVLVQQAPPKEDQPIARQPTPGAPNTGAQSDRESDPTSTIDVPREHWQLGKPLAAQGLEIMPKRPDVTTLTALTAWPRNPTCRITFDKHGVPAQAVLLEATGDSRVDRAIEAALYRWRAAGKPLDDLKDGQSIAVTIRLLINPERKRTDGE